MKALRVPTRRIVAVLVLAGSVLCVAVSGSMAAEAGPQSASAGNAELSQLSDAISRVEPLRTLVTRLEAIYSDIPPEDVLARTVIDARLDRAWTSMVSEIHRAAGLLVALNNSGEPAAEQREAVERLMLSVPPSAFELLDRLSGEVTLPTPDQSATEQSALFARASLGIDRVDALFDHLLRHLALLDQLSIDSSTIEEELNRRLEARAAGTSAFLDVSVWDVESLITQASVLPNDTEIAARLAVARQRVELSAEVLRGVVEQLRSQGLETKTYEAQLIARTGEITTDVLDVSVLRSLASSTWTAMTDWFAENGAGFLFSSLIFLLIIYATFKIAAVVRRLITLALDRGSAQLSQLLKRMIVSASRGVIIALGTLIGLSQLGISLGPLLAGLGIAGFVIGFALQDTLSNFASGLMILFYRPFDVGDVVEVGGVFGTVNKMSLVNTTILTVDNQTLVVPNNKIWGDVIKNLNSQRQRRVDMMFGIGYADDIPHAERVLTDIIASHESVLKDPEPVVRLHELGDSSVNFIVRPWVKSEDYWSVYWDVTRAVKMRFDAEGISIPFPQRDVHLYDARANESSDV